MTNKNSAHSFARYSGRHVVACTLPVHPQFKMRLLTLAVLSACASASMAAQNHAPVPVNPLPTGGVVANPGSASIINSAHNLMVIKQTAPKTTIHWNSFDIAHGYTVRFDQPNASAEAMNYIGGAKPSVIQGTLSANGKVYLVNSNGILFDGTAQVNVNTLIASSLNISQQTFDNGITSSLDVDGDPTLVATMLLDSAGQVVNYGTIRSVKVDGASGEVVTTAKVDAATGQTVQQAVEEGGSIMLFAPQVENHGLITANNGQVILAAGKSVYLKPYNHPASVNYNANDLSMRGFLVKVTAAPEGALNLSNLIAAQNLNSAANIGGEIRSDRGNTTLTGLVVNQAGRVSANTATTVNGSIWLKAENYDAAGQQTTYGTLTTSKDSVTETLPEADGTTLAESAAYADNSVYATNGGYQGVIKLIGETIVHEGQALAPGGRIVVGKEYVNNDASVRPPSNGRVYLGADSVLSVAGEWVDQAYESNFLTFKLGSLNLADAPLQKGGFLINQEVTVDARQASPLLFDISDRVAGVQRTVLEKTTAGGAITVNTGEFIAAAGSKVDVSGGGYRYGDGTQTTTYLVSHGRLFDIATAPPNLQYDGVVTKTAKAKGYVEGKNAGLLAIDAQQMVFGGQFAGGVTSGIYQRAASAMPDLGKLVLGTQSILPGLEFSTVKDATTINNLDTDAAAYALQNVTFGASAATRLQLDHELADVKADPLNAAFPAALLDNVLLPVDVFGGANSSNALASASQGFGTLTVRANGSISVPQDVALDLGVGGSLLWLAPQIEVAGAVSAQGGTLAFNQRKEDTVFGMTHLGEHSVVSTAGGWVNDVYGTNGVNTAPNVIDGGSVTIKGSSTLDAGSRIDASGGATLNATGKLSYGNGGDIALPTIALDGVSLRAYGGKQGGSLTLDANTTIDVGGAFSDALLPGFFTQGGFTQYTLAGIDQINFNEDIHPVAFQRIARANAKLAKTGTPFAAISDVQSNSPDYLRTAASLMASTNASTAGSFQLGANETGITVAPGVSIRTDPLGHIDLSSKTRMDIEGALVAPAGSISLSLDPDKAFYYNTLSGGFNVLNIGDQSVISTAGIFLPNVGPRGLTTGQVLAGGTVSISARKNDLEIAPHAIIDVSGVSQVVDIPSGAGGTMYMRTHVASEGGNVAINATENAYLGGTFKGNGGDASVAGGSFALNLAYNGQFTETDAADVVYSVTNGDGNADAALKRLDANGQQLKHTIVVSQSATPLAHDGSLADSSVIGNLVDASGNFATELRANISADQLVSGAQGEGGFDSVVLKSDNAIQFNPGVNNFAPRAQLQLDTPELRVAGAGAARIGSGSKAAATWRTAQIEWVNTPSIFRRSSNPVLSSLLVPVTTQAGSGELSLAAGQISLAGNISANGVADLKLNSGGDIRFEGFPLDYTAQAVLSDDADRLFYARQALSGRLSSAGNITLQANQIYPATAVDYAVAVEQTSVSMNPDGTVNVSRNPVVDGLLSVRGNDSAVLAPVFSAGGSLTLKADHIDQAGTIKAPLGSIVLEGGQSLTLKSGSETSVSALWQHDGVETELVIPYGYTQSVGQSLWYGGLQTEAVPSKQITASADTVTVASGATLDIRGGGDFSAMEWIPGIGGSKDVLAAVNTYAIVPGVLFQTSDSHLDNLAPVSVNAGAAYNMVHLAAGSGLEEGDYALLPAYYALLPGAYLVKAQSGDAFANLNPGYAATQADGSVVVAGKLGYAGTAIRQSTWSGYSIQSGVDALTQTARPQAEYMLTGSKFFTDRAAKNNTTAPGLPQDGGRFSIGATSNLVFQGNLLSKAAHDAVSGQPGAIGQVDIYGAKFAILDNNTPAPIGYTGLRADDLSRLDANLIIGGKRADTANGQSVDVVASDVTVDLNGGELKLPELWLAAKDNLTVSGDSTLTAVGNVVDRSGTLTVNSDGDGKQYGALLGLSSGGLMSVARAGTLDNAPEHGNLTIEAGAALNASGGSIVVDSTGTPQVEGIFNSDTLAIGARQIALGEAPLNSSALVLGGAQLAALGSAKNFVLRSYSSIDLYGNVNLGAVGTGSFTFDSAGLVGHDVNGTGAPVDLSAGTIALQNLSGTALAATPPGTGTLTLNADKLVLGESGTAGFTVAGFQQVDVKADEVSLKGSGTLVVASDLNIESACIAAGGRLADQKVKAYDDSQQIWHAIKMTQSANTLAFTEAPQPGGKLQIDASGVDFGGNISLKSGRLAIAAHGTSASNDVTLKNGSSIDLSAYEKTFAQGTANLTESASAGRLTLSSEHGSIAAQSGSAIDLRGGMAGGDAGVLTVEAANGTVALDGNLLADAALGQSGNVNIDVKNLANFSAVNTSLEAGNFGQTRYLRARTGDIEVSSTDSVNAKNVQLVADAGSIDVNGSIEASSVAGGGAVQLDAGQGIRLHGTSNILAKGTSANTTADAAYSDGGSVGLYARNGQLNFDSGAVIDVSAAAAGKSSGGEIVFSAPRTEDSNNLQATLAGQVKVSGGTVSVPGGRAPESGTVTLEGYKRYDGVTTTSAAASTAGAVFTDFNTFMNAADAIQGAALASLTTAGSDVSSAGLKIRAGVELVSSGDMAVDTDWDLTNSDWLPAGATQTAGRLALRAAGDLKVDARLGLPNESAVPPDAGWSLQLAGGSDAASADVLAVNASTTQGDVTLGSNGKLTSSTGDIQITAGRDFSATSPASVVYTTGRALALPILIADPALNGKQFAPEFGVNFVDGGSVSISAQRDITGSGGYADVNDWLRRNTVVGGSSLTSAITAARGYGYQPAYWWVDRLGNTKAKTKGIEGIATLGGGNISIVAEHAVKNLSVASATSRSASTTATLVLVNDRNNIPSENSVYGGGNVRVDAGGDLLGGQYLMGRGTASLTAGGVIGGLSGAFDSATAPAFWLMGWSDDPALRGAQVKAEALGGVTLGSAANPTVTQNAKNAGGSVSNTAVGYRATTGFFFSYAPEDSLALKSVGGNLAIRSMADSTAKDILPPRFSAVAMEGSVSSGTSQFSAATVGVDGLNSLAQYPDSNGLFHLLAGDAVHDLVLRPSDYDPSRLTTASNQTLMPTDFLTIGKVSAFKSPKDSDAKMVTPSALDGYRYAVVADTGDVSNSAFYFPQRSVVAAGQDIANVQLDLQNLGAGDVSHVAAGRDLLYSNVLSNGTEWGTMPHLLIAGPGSLVVETGRDVNLGAVSTASFEGALSQLEDVSRIDAIGNAGNASLPTADAASLTIVSGVNTGVLSVEQSNSLFSVLRSVGLFQELLGQVQGNKIPADTAIAAANAVTTSANAAIDTLFAGAVQAGSSPVYETPIDPNGNGNSAAGKLSDAYNGALAAANNLIAALFKDGQLHHGDITLYNARISSSTNPGGLGGSINLLAPNGDIKVGLPSASSGRNIGIFTTAGGAINAYLNGDMNVNLSKVATFQGGDILLYTSGNGGTLDAGRGSRSARTSSPPRQVAEKDPITGLPTGKILLLPPLDVSGSGIRTVSYDPDGFGALQQPDPGKVYLIAPTGTIDAGEAGVSSSSGLVVAALVVKNGDNFSAAGSSSGVPSVSAVTAPAPVSSDAANANKAADSMAQTNNAETDSSKDANANAFRPTYLTVEILGFGIECEKSDADCRKRKSGGV
jgi:filamentous hemagglutinin family protein